MKIVVAFVWLAVEAHASRFAQGFLGAGAGRMQPEVVAHSLAHMESEWRAQAIAFTECNATSSSEDDMSGCTRAPKAFQASCSTVVSALVQSSGGDRSEVTEYMGVVCGEHELQGWQLERCQSLASFVVSAMSADSAGNRNDLDLQDVCHGFWKKIVSDEKVLAEKEKAEEALERAEDEKEAAKEAAQQEEQRKKDEERRMEEDAKREKEAAEDHLKSDIAVNHTMPTNGTVMVAANASEATDACAGFMRTKKAACASCTTEASKSPGPTGPCTCQVGDCTAEMAKHSGSCGSDGTLYFCATCVPVKYELADGEVSTHDVAKDQGWTDVGLC